MDKNFLFAIWLGTYSVASFAACDESFISNTLHKLGYVGESSEFVACKQLPYTNSQSIVAIAKRQKGTEIGDSETMGDYNLDIALIDDNKKSVLKRTVFKQRFVSDGYRFDGIELDTANYTVAPNLRAIGIRANFHIDMGFTSSQSLSLFITSGKAFKEILSDADMRIFFTKNWPPCSNETREAKRTLAIGKRIKKGYFDLIVTEKLVDAREYEERNQEGECMSKNNEKIKTYNLQFDGKRYVVPVEMREFDCRIC